jgi:hypothetical protein
VGGGVVEGIEGFVGRGVVGLTLVVGGGVVEGIRLEVAEGVIGKSLAVALRIPCATFKTFSEGSFKPSNLSATPPTVPRVSNPRPPFSRLRNVK